MDVFSNPPCLPYILNDAVSAVTQNVKINGKKGDVYSVGGWFKGLFDDNAVSSAITTSTAVAPQALSNTTAQLKVTYSYTETVTTTDESTNETTTTEQTLTENFAVDFIPHVNGWQYAKDSFALKGDVESVDVTVITKNIPTDSFATGVELTLKEENSQVQEDYIIDDDIDFTEDTCSCGCEDCIYGDNCPCNGAVEGNCACPECLREETTAEDFFGNTISNRSFDGVNYIETFASYTENGNCVASYTDENGNTTFYDYDTLNSVLKSVAGQIGTGSETSITNYTYDAVGRIVSVSTTANDSGSQTLQYVYTDDKITEIITPNGKYKIVYDVWGQVLSVNIVVTSNNKESLIPLIKYTYNSGVNRNQILTATYVNSDSDNSVYEYTYYDNGTLKTVTLNKNLKHSIEYNNLGELTKIDNVGGRSVQYTAEDVNIYNDDGTLVYKSVLTDDGLSIEENYGVKYKELEVENDYDSLTGLSTQTSGLEVADLYRIEQSAVTDWFDREKSRTTTIYDLCGDTEENSTEVRGKVTTEYEYPSLSGGKTSSAIEKYINKTYNSSGTEIYLFDGYYYEYDKQNKISAEKILNSDGTTTDKYSYKYDKLGQLVRYNDIVSNKTYTYSYDANGNILSKNEYPYTLSDELGTATNTTTYGYDSQWKDKLTCVGDKIITYDNIGNPTSYLGATLTWEGRTLTTYEDETQILQYEYDENGMRYRTTITSKEDGQVGSYEYVWIDGKLISIVFINEGSTHTAKYLYNEFDEPVGMISTGADGTLSTYYYLKNAQGDITNIVGANGGKMVEFTYDVFGSRTTHYQADTSTIAGMVYWAEQAMVSALTPFGYRGYCYDTYTGLYYLQSRYYDPEIGRFINADDTNYLNATGTVLGCNLFAYCENDPVNRVDPKGTSYYSYIDYYKFEHSKYFITDKIVLKTNSNKVISSSSIFFTFENNIVKIYNKYPAIRNIINKKWLKYLASDIYAVAKQIDKYSLLGRTIKGIQFEILVHYILYIGLKDVKNRTDTEDAAFEMAKTTDIGTPNKGLGYDWNAASFEKLKHLYSVFETKLFSKQYTGYALAKALIKLNIIK